MYAHEYKKGLSSDALASFQAGNEIFFTRSRKSRNHAEAYVEEISKIDADIVKNSHLWMDTGLFLQVVGNLFSDMAGMVADPLQMLGDMKIRHDRIEAFRVFHH